MTNLSLLNGLVSLLRIVTVSGLVLWFPTTAHAQSEAVEYYGVDALGSVRVVFDASGNVAGRMDYGPFGEELAPSVGKQLRIYAALFTDEEAGLAHAEARSYQLRTGRFSTVDAEYAGIFEPQRWNRYAYVRNSPLVRIDPSGNGDCSAGYWCPGTTTGPAIDIGLRETVNVVATAPRVSAPPPSGFSLATAIGLALASVATQPSAIPGYHVDWGHILATRTAPGIVISDISTVASPDSSTSDRLKAAAALTLLAVPAAGELSIGSRAGGQVLPMKIVKLLPPGTAGGIVNLAKGLTFLTGNEHALVRLGTGERALVSGGPGGIAFAEGQITRIIGHTHPYGLGSIGPSAADAAALSALGQTHSYVLDGAGQIIRIGPK